MRSARLWGLALVALVAAGAAAVSAQDPAEPVDPDLASVEVTLWRSVADPSVLYLSTRPAGGSWRTHDAPLDMSRLSRSGRFHQSNAITVTVTLTNGDRVNVEVTVWRSVADPSVLYLSTRPQGGSWRTEQAPLDMSRLSRSGRFHQSNAITVDVPLPEPNEPAAPGGDRGSVDSGDDHICTMQSTAARVIASTVRVETSTSTVGTAFYVGNGQFITAAHVIDDNPATIRLHNTSYDAYASVIGYTSDDDGDIAILSAPSSGLTALEWAGTLSVGETIAVVGYPEGLGLSASITRGIVSRLFTAEGVSYIQTDSAVSPGNSGGPLVDACGRVAGVMSASYVGERGSEGLHFAVGEPTLAARLSALRSGQYVRPVEEVQESYLTITAFCTELPSEDLQAAECARRSSSFTLGGGRTWSLWARGVGDWDDVVYRFNGGARQYESGVKAALQALGYGCHELQIAEEDVSTHWSAAYQFCIVQSTPTRSYGSWRPNDDSTFFSLRGSSSDGNSWDESPILGIGCFSSGIAISFFTNEYLLNRNTDNRITVGYSMSGLPVQIENNWYSNEDFDSLIIGTNSFIQYLGVHSTGTVFIGASDHWGDSYAAAFRIDGVSNVLATLPCGY